MTTTLDQGLSLFLFALPAPSPAQSASPGMEPVAPAPQKTRLEAGSEEHGSPAFFSWADFKGGALFLHTKGGSDNTGLGNGALANVLEKET